jgi:hypothetical protein
MVLRLTGILLLFCLAACEPPPPYSPALLQQWNAAKAEQGPTFAGSPAWHAHMDFVEQGLTAAGVVAGEKYPAPYRRWWAPDRPMPQQRQLLIDGVSLPVASYWAYSGSTPVAGVKAPLIVYDRKLTPAELAGHIVVFQVGQVPASMAKMFSIGHEYATDDFPATAPGIADDQWYQSNFVTRFGHFDEVLRDSGAAGAVVIFDMSAARLEGLYTFPLLNLGVVGVPGIYVARDTGKAVLAAAEQGKPARLTLVAHEAEVAPYFYSAVLPGRDYGTDQDEQILLVTHSDGPNLTQENGTLGILALVRHYATVSQAERPRSLRVLFDPQHYSPGRHIIDWYKQHPESMAKVVASLGVEHLGQLEYSEDESGYGLSGRPEPWQIFVRNDEQLIAAAINALETTGVPRTELRVPEKKGQGRWTGLGDVALKYDLAGYATLSNMSGYWGTTAGIESFDASLAHQQLDVLVLLVAELMHEI